MKLPKELLFFSYLLESYAAHKQTDAGTILQTLDDHNLTNYVFDMYEMYHSEAIENAFTDLDSLITAGRPAW